MFIFSQLWLLIMAVITVLHWIIPPRWRGGWLILVTAAFIGYYNLPSLVILSILTFWVYKLAGRDDSISGKKLILLLFSVGGLLAGYKAYAAFGGHIIGADEAGGFGKNLIFPLGLSYYTFRCIHYGIEKYKHTIPAHDFYSFAQYMFFLPTLIAGPIHRYGDFSRDLRRKRWNPYMFAEGLERIIYGYVKISFIANLLVNFIFALYIQDVLAYNGALGRYLEMVKIGLNLYFLFSGYSDVVIGFGLLLGFKVMENFNHPFLAANISDFWKRWHISLTSFCRDYVYMGTISVTRSASLAAIASMLVMGLWHEFSLRYLVWGLYHGIGIMAWQQFQILKRYLPQTTNKMAVYPWRVFATLLTLHYVFIGFILVRHDTLGAAFSYLGKIFLFWT